MYFAVLLKESEWLNESRSIVGESGRKVDALPGSVYNFLKGIEGSNPQSPPDLSVPIHLSGRMMIFSFFMQVPLVMIPDRRMSKHAEGMMYSAARRPWRPVYFAMCGSLPEGSPSTKRMKSRNISSN